MNVITLNVGEDAEHLFALPSEQIETRKAETLEAGFELHRVHIDACAHLGKCNTGTCKTQNVVPPHFPVCIYEDMLL